MKRVLAALAFFLAHPAHAQQQVAPACHHCTFSDAIDRSIRLDDELTTNRDSCCGPEWLGLLPAPRPASQQEYPQSNTGPKAIGWSAWSSKFSLLSWYLADSSATSPGRPTRLPDTSGRLLYLAGTGPVVPTLLLEFRGSQFRFIELNNDAAAKLDYQLYPHPEGDLLVLTNTDGSISKIYNTSTTWLSIFDLRRDIWLLDTVVAASIEDNEYWSTQRFYQVKDAGRTVMLGPYRDGKQRYQYATLPRGKDLPRSSHDLPPGTYHLANGRYQLGSQLPASRAPRVALPRAAVGAAEVTGTFRAAQSQELAIQALGGGKLRVQFRGAFSKFHGVWHRGVFSGEATIQADSATLVHQQASPCTLRLRFVRPGVLQVREYGAGCEAEAVGTYQKTSAEKPFIR